MRQIECKLPEVIQISECLCLKFCVAKYGQVLVFEEEYRRISSGICESAISVAFRYLSLINLYTFIFILFRRCGPNKKKPSHHTFILTGRGAYNAFIYNVLL